MGKRQHITSLPFLRDVWYFPLGTSGTGIDFVFVYLYLVLALLSILGAFKASKYSGFEVFCLKVGIFEEECFRLAGATPEGGFVHLFVILLVKTGKQKVLRLA